MLHITLQALLIAKTYLYSMRPDWPPFYHFDHLGWPCPEQGQNLNSQLSSAISASILPIEPQDHTQPICRNPVNGLVMIFRFCWLNWSKYCIWKLTARISALFGTGTVYLTYLSPGRVNGQTSGQGQNSDNQLSNAIFAQILSIEPPRSASTHSQEPCEWFKHNC